MLVHPPQVNSIHAKQRDGSAVEECHVLGTGVRLVVFGFRKMVVPETERQLCKQFYRR